jgi:2-polyprenyl-6-methoxyphenol hydroxylase-like FAD-dependent oxidoreductase
MSLSASIVQARLTHLGLADALELGQALVKLATGQPSRQDTYRALREYEKRIMERVRPEMEISYVMNSKFYAPDAAREFAKFFAEMAAGGGPSAGDDGGKKATGGQNTAYTIHTIVEHST